MRGRLRNVLVCLGILASGCGGGGTDASELLPGLYPLESINAQPLPFVLVFVDAANQIEFVEGSVSVNQDGSFADSATLRFTEAGVASSETQVTSGQWTKQGNSLTFTPNDGSDPYSMTWNGSERLTQGIQGFSLVYER